MISLKEIISLILKKDNEKKSLVNLEIYSFEIEKEDLSDSNLEENKGSINEITNYNRCDDNNIIYEFLEMHLSSTLSIKEFLLNLIQNSENMNRNILHEEFNEDELKY